jgi:protein-tyrosine phosphatase
VKKKSKTSYSLKNEFCLMEKFREVAIAHKGKIFLHSMPGRKESWSEAKQAIAQHNISYILCLTANAELIEKSPDYAAFIESELANKAPVKQIIHIAIEDFSIPTDAGLYTEQINLAAQSVIQGAHLLIHCAAGIGRTGCAAIALLQELGASASEAQSLVLAAGSNPETDEQWRFIRGYRPKAVAS